MQDIFVFRLCSQEENYFFLRCAYCTCLVQLFLYCPILISFTHLWKNLFAVFPSLLVCLTSPITAIRQTVLDVISLITSRSTDKTSVVILGNIVSESSQEIIADETFIAR